MIDLHSHILPGIDDGAKTLDDSIAMAKQALDCGVTHMVCTPHIHQGVFDNTLESIKLSFHNLIRALAEREIPLKLAYSCEVRVCPEVIAWVQNKRLPFLGIWKGRNALLLELPHSHIPPGIENLIKWLLNNGVQPIIPHPERNRDIIADYRKLQMLRRLGCLFQVTAGAFTQGFKHQVYELSMKMMQDGFVDYVASDTHSAERRPNEMGNMRKVLNKEITATELNRISVDVPKEITKELIWL